MSRLRNFILKFKDTISTLYKLVIIATYIISFYILFIPTRWINIDLNSTYILILTALYGVALFIVSKIFGAYCIGKYRIREGIYFHLISLVLVNLLIAVVIVLIQKDFLNLTPLVLLTLVQILLAVVWVVFGNTMYFNLLEPLNILLIYGDSPESILQKFLSNTRRYNVCKAIYADKSSTNIEKEIDSYQGVIIYGLDNNVKDYVIGYCFENNKNIFLMPNVSDIIQAHVECLNLFDTPVFFINNTGLSTEQRILKRFLDLLVIIPTAIVSIPLMLITAISIKLYDHGPVFYKQKRLTLDGKEFNVLKFRSMRVDAEKESGARLASKEDDRITPVGKVIRAIRFDELPQLINILKGEMSIVGPRPERPEIANEYIKIHPEFAYRLKVKAGLTGYAQVLGKYNTAPLDKVKLDVLYIKNYSFLLDLKLIVMTVKILFMSESTEGVEKSQQTAATK